MSAYVVDRDHIRFLVTAAQRMNPRYTGRFSWWSEAKQTRVSLGEDMNPSDLGQMLWNENILSVTHRYPDCKDADGTVKYDRLPGVTNEVYLYQHPLAQGWGRIDPVAVLKACSCYEYQSCEHKGWEDSDAHNVIESIRSVAISSLPGYEDAEWGAPTINAAV